MYIVIHHTIHDAQKFWGEAEKNLPSLPEGLRLHTAMPGTDGVNAVCLWEAPDVDSLRGYLEPLVGDVSDNDYIPVDAGSAIGLPSVS